MERDLCVLDRLSDYRHIFGIREGAHSPLLFFGGIMLIQQTSREAFSRVGTTLRDRVSLLMESRAYTCDEVEVLLGAKHQSISATIRHLVKDGFLSGTGERRLTRSGRNAIVWGSVE